MRARLLLAAAATLGIGVPAAVLVLTVSAHPFPPLAALVAPGLLVAWLDLPEVRRWTAAGLAVTSLLTWGYLGFVVRGIVLRAEAVRNLEVLRAHARAIEGFRRDRARLPDTLTEVVGGGPDDDWVTGRDGWDHELRYLRVDDGWVLVSPGRDGRWDGLDLLALRARGTQTSTCGAWSADQAVSDRGVLRACGK